MILALSGMAYFPIGGLNGTGISIGISCFSWSGRPGSNRRRPAWEIERKLKIKNLAFMAAIECDKEHPVFNGLLLHFVNGAKMEQKNLLLLPSLCLIQIRAFDFSAR